MHQRCLTKKKKRAELLEKKPHPKDVEVGSRIRLNRKTQGLSQTALGKMIGVSFQQVQKYESGATRIGSGRLTDIAKALGVKSSDLLLDEAPHAKNSKAVDQAFLDDMMSSQGIELHMAFFSIKDPKVRASLLSAIQNIANSLDQNGK